MSANNSTSAANNGTTSGSAPSSNIESTKADMEKLMIDKAYSTSVTQHPMYQTTGNDYGLEPPCTETKPPIHAAKTNSFTKGFTGGMYKNCSLNTSADPPTYEETTHISMY